VAKTVGKGKSSSLRGRTSAEPETDLVDSSGDEPRDDEQDVAEDDEFEAETGNGMRSGNAVTRYAAESFVELYSNTTWPTWREAWNFTLIVLVMAAVVAVILGIADLGLTRVLTWFVGLGK